MDEAAKQFYVDLGKKITKARKRRKLRQSDMAEMLGITQSAFSQKMRAATGTDAYTLLRIADILNVPMADLLADSPGLDTDLKCACCGTSDKHLMVCLHCRQMLEHATPERLRLGVNYLSFINREM